MFHGNCGWLILSIISTLTTNQVHCDVANTVERSLRDVTNNLRPFGGKTVLFMGDFKQLLPVVRFGKGSQHTLQQCEWWSRVSFLNFTKNWRAERNPEYTQFLENVGRGTLDYVTVPDECRVDSYSSMIAAVYGDTFDNGHQILALTLETCSIINRMCLSLLPGPIIEKHAADHFVDCNNPDDFPRDYVESLDMKGAPPFMLQFVVGAKYMCIRNMDIKNGIINGTMVKLLRCGSRIAQFEVLTGKSKGSVELFTKIMFTITPEASGLPFSIQRLQFPVIPAYCLSVHKAQGQSLLRVGIIFESDPFTHGQLYTALSRVGGWERVYAMHQGDDIKNCVLRHLLQAVPG
jgi:ATP-dependent DNA helicase PIF1